jgi:UDP-N-acetylmuramoylalanine--D-glutamate ligase
VEHRLECVTTIKGVTYLNDSSSTNPLSTIRAMAVVANPTILLLGGSEKGANYSELARVAAHKAKRTILYGATRNRIAQAFHEVENYAFLVEEGDLRAVLERARSLASPGDVVLFSPACASFDMFRDFEHRGEIFRELVLEMEHGHP